ncbi:MAG: hypothetical protein WD534_04050, partial [Phycisphaeraceae bacterium]
ARSPKPLGSRPRINCDAYEWPRVLRGVLEEVYREPLGDLDYDTAANREIRQQFQEYDDLSANVAKKSAHFFSRLREETGVKRIISAPKRPKKRRTPAQEALPMHSQTNQDNTRNTTQVQNATRPYKLAVDGVPFGQIEIPDQLTPAQYKALQRLVNYLETLVTPE